MPKTVAIVQARVGSSRLFNKVFLKVGDLLLIQRVIKTLERVKNIDQVVIATTTARQDFQIEKWCKDNEIECFRGSENNVLKRYFDCALFYKADTIIRITADDPFKDSLLIKKMIYHFEARKLDFLCNNNPPSFPEGFDVEIFNFDTLKYMHLNAKNDFQREHVTQFCHQNKDQFKFENYSSKDDYSIYRLTIDTIFDLNFCNELCELLPDLKSANLPLEKIINVLKLNTEFSFSNIKEERSEMFKK